MAFFKKFLNSFRYAFKGVWISFSERNMYIHLVAAIVVTACGVYFKISPMEWCVVVLCIGAVTSAEIFNTAIEWLTDLVQPDHHPLAGKVKDAAAGGVLMISLAAAIAGLIVFWKYFFP